MAVDPAIALARELALIEAFERMIRSAQAEQYRRVQAARELAAEVEGVTDASSPVDREFATRSFVAELATTLVVHEASAGRLIAEAGHLTGPRVATLTALTSGEISVAQVRTVLDLPQALSHETAADLERAALEMAPTTTNAACRRRLHRLRECLHPEPLAERRARAVDERRVALDTGRVGAHITVTVPVLSLLGVTDEPAELEGYGPIDADTARRLAAHAPSLERVLVHPETGAYLSYGRTRYRAPADLAGYVRIRDGRCRFPGCARRAGRSDIDHTTAWAHGGVTADYNISSLCRKHHRLKHNTGWQMVHEASGVIRWTSPAGHVLRTFPERPFTPVAAGPLPTQAPPYPPPTDAKSQPLVDEDPPWAHVPPAVDAA